MDTKKREDLRVRKTKQAIRNAFKEMICEMDLNEITIKELTLRAQINRKTFYLHYQCLDDVMTELEDRTYCKHTIRLTTQIKYESRIYSHIISEIESI